MEIVVVLVLALLVFGPSRLPQAGRSLGQAMREFRKATQAARTELGLDEVTEGIKDLKSSVGIDDLKSSLSVDLKSGTTTPAQTAAAAALAVAPPADKPVPVAAAGSDTTPLETPAPEADDVAAVDEPAAVEPAVDESPAAEAAAADTTAAGTPAGSGDA
jgi:TatA/E family protein of Tat protein translocase